MNKRIWIIVGAVVLAGIVVGAVMASRNNVGQGGPLFKARVGNGLL